MYAVVVGTGMLLFFMIMLLISLQYVHLKQRHSQKGWDDLKIELLGDEDAAKVMEKTAERLSYNRAQMYYQGLLCAHCKLVGDSVTLAEHVNVVYVFHFLVIAHTKLIYSHKIPEATDKDIVTPLDYKVFPLDYWLWPPRPVAPSLPVSEVSPPSPMKLMREILESQINSLL